MQWKRFRLVLFRKNGTITLYCHILCIILAHFNSHMLTHVEPQIL